MSGDPEQEYFSDGISEDIITDLSKLSELHVIARNSTFNYKGKGVDVKQVGRDLGVRYVLEGSVRKAGNRVRVTGQLIDAANGAHIWAERFDRDLTDIFFVQDELTKEIIAALKVKLTPEDKPDWPGRAQSTLKPITSFYADASLRIPTHEKLATSKRASCARTRRHDQFRISAAALAFIAFTHVE